MRKLLIFLGVAVAFLCGALTARAAEGRAAVSCDNRDFDFGKRDSRENVTHTFVLRNEGSGVLRISGVDATCGCTVTNVGPLQVLPGGKAEVTVTFRLAGRSGPQAKAIVVNSNARNCPSLELIMRGDALSRVTMKPSSVFFGRVPAGKGGSDGMELSTDGSVSLSITRVKSDSPHFTPFCETLQPGRRIRLKVALARGAPEGQLQGEIAMETDSKEYPVLYVPVSAHVVGELLVFPKEIVLEEGADPITKSAFVTAGQVSNFRVLGVTSPVAWLQPKVVPFGEAGFRILLRELKPLPELAGACLVITTDAPTMREIRIPFRIIRPSGPAR